MSNLLDASCRVALAGLIHDLGKFAQRADLDFPKDVKETHLQLYCPQKEAEGKIWWTHQHAAYTALAFDIIEKSAPDLISKDSYPFASRQSAQDCDVTDSIINAASAHHSPQTFLQWVITTADRVSSGFEREQYDESQKSEMNFLRTRLRSLFEQVCIGETSRACTPTTLSQVYPLKPLSAEALFVQPAAEAEPRNDEAAKTQYRLLWNKFCEGIQGKAGILGSLQKNWPLWLDAFDTAWLTYTQAIPSATAFGVKPDVSLYDHSKATAALATALWRWHEENKTTDLEAVKRLKERSDWDTEKFLLVQGDFFGIQNFIFSDGSETNKNSAKILRGRSFYVSLLCELAALKVLQALSLPSTSQIINAAGKFTIVAPNTDSVQAKLDQVRDELNAWFVKSTFATCGIGLVATPASCHDFTDKNYSKLQDRLYADMERAKYQRFNLCHNQEVVLPTDFTHGVCRWNSKLPADGLADGASCAMSRDQILIGLSLTKYSRLLVLTEDAQIANSESVKVCELPIFGYKVAFVKSASECGVFGKLIDAEKLLRCWEFSLPILADEVLWHGYARRAINGYIPRFDEIDLKADGSLAGDVQVGDVKTFSDLAIADCRDGKGVHAIMTMKGDVDNLGLIFRRGLVDEAKGRYMTFAKTATLSRQVNAFFSAWLPLLCAKEFRNTYTVFAGGDDFFMIGPWHEVQRLARRLERDFNAFVAQNPEIHFSVGLVMTKPAVPARTLARMAEETLSEAKGAGKNRMNVFGCVVPWCDVAVLEELEEFFKRAVDDYGVTTSYLYSLFNIIDMQADKMNPVASLWRSRLFYSTSRLFERQGKHTGRDTNIARNEFLGTLDRAFEKCGATVRIPLTNTFYLIREVK